jgi:hypothetical protein
MDRLEFLKALDELLQMPHGTLKGAEKLEEVTNWDSVAMIEFVALVDTNNHVTLTPRQIAQCKTIDDLLALAKVEC